MTQCSCRPPHSHTWSLPSKFYPMPKLLGGKLSRAVIDTGTSTYTQLTNPELCLISLQNSSVPHSSLVIHTRHPTLRHRQPLLSQPREHISTDTTCRPAPDESGSQGRSQLHWGSLPWLLRGPRQGRHKMSRGHVPSKQRCYQEVQA